MDCEMVIIPYDDMPTETSGFNICTMCQGELEEVDNFLTSKRGNYQTEYPSCLSSCVDCGTVHLEMLEGKKVSFKHPVLISW